MIDNDYTEFDMIGWLRLMQKMIDCDAYIDWLMLIVQSYIYLLTKKLAGWLLDFKFINK